MGNSLGIPAPHLRMYENLINIQSPTTRVQMIQTLLSSPEHAQAAKQAGLYGHLLHYCQAVQAGSSPLPLLPGEAKPQPQHQKSLPAPEIQQRNGQQHQQMVVRQEQVQKSNEKALNYFSACLRILELEEEVALTPEALKAAYKKAVVRAHPDKGGSEREFEAVTRAYAYLGEILRRIHGGRAVEGKVEAPAALASSRSTEEDKWKHVQPVALNPKKLDMQTFNAMFEKTKIPDPEESGYGDWLKGGDSSDSPANRFNGKFNREVFLQAFQEEQAAKAKSGNQNALTVQERVLSNRIGYATELGRGQRDDYTAANDKGLQYTDLKKAYTEYNTFSQETAGVKVEARDIGKFREERKAAPKPLMDYEMQALQEAEAAAKRAEDQRKMRLAQQAVQEENYFQMMQRMVIRN